LLGASDPFQGFNACVFAATLGKNTEGAGKILDRITSVYSTTYPSRKRLMMVPRPIICLLKKNINTSRIPFRIT
jgi:hypothetical protein